MQQGRNSQISGHTTTASDSTCYLEGYLYGFYYRLSKYAHFWALQHPFTTSMVAQIFMDHVFKLHGMPHSIVFDHDPTFTSIFWQELFKLQGTQLHLSTTYHPQTDGQTEVVNKCLEKYLRCFSSEKKNQWAQWLPLVEWWYNTSYHTTTRMNPFDAVYG